MQIFLLTIYVSVILCLPGRTDPLSPNWTDRQKKIILHLEKKVLKKNDQFMLETENFKCKTPVDRRWTAELSLYMEVFYTKFRKLVPYSERVKIKPTIEVLSDEETYRERFNKHGRGHYRYNKNQQGRWSKFHVYTYIDGPKARTDFSSFYHPILQHEATHILLQKIFGNMSLPIWFDEGFANLFQFWDIKQSVQTNLRTHWRKSSYYSDLRSVNDEGNTDNLSIQRIVNIDSYDAFNPDEMGEEARLNYAIAESLIHYLVSSPQRRKAMSRYIKRMKENRRAPNFWPEEVIQKIEPHWQEYVKDVLRRFRK